MYDPVNIKSISLLSLLNLSLKRRKLPSFKVYQNAFYKYNAVKHENEPSSSHQSSYHFNANQKEMIDVNQFVEFKDNSFLFISIFNYFFPLPMQSTNKEDEVNLLNVLGF